MTRINAGIDPSTLTDRHLLAEHREMKRIPNCVKRGNPTVDMSIDMGDDTEKLTTAQAMAYRTWLEITESVTENESEDKTE